MAEKMSDIFSYDDALKALAEVGVALQTARDANFNAETGAYVSNDAWHYFNGQHLLVDALIETLSNEQTVTDLIRTANAREEQA